MDVGEFSGVKNPVNNDTQSTRVIVPAHHNAFFLRRKLKPFQPFRLKYAMTAITNGPHLTSGLLAEVTPKRGVLNNDRVLPYVDINFGQELYNCKAVLYVSSHNDKILKVTKNYRFWSLKKSWIMTFTTSISLRLTLSIEEINRFDQTVT